MKNWAILIALSVVLLTVGLGPETGRADGKRIFSHIPHVEEGLSCTDCHQGQEGVELKPKAETCTDCHEEEVMLPVGLPALSRDLLASFPHGTHAEALECSDCHEGIGKDEIPAGKPLVGEAKCFSCHEDNEVEIAKDNCAGCHAKAPEGDLSAKVESSTMAFHFSHANHVPKVGCGDCHKNAHQTAGATEEGKENAGSIHCIECHEQRKAGPPETGCTQCHKDNPSKIRPPDHKAVWMRNHGRESAWREFDEHGKECAQCHREDACVSCHKQRRPRDHTGLWRMRTHGQAASWGRDRCKTCHETSSCVQCHRNTRPINHTGGWRFLHSRAVESGTYGDCTACHQTSYCDQCHRQHRLP